jgi:hypothetical protein
VALALEAAARLLEHCALARLEDYWDFGLILAHYCKRPVIVQTK